MSLTAWRMVRVCTAAMLMLSAAGCGGGGGGGGSTNPPPATVGSVELSWTAPTENTDGSALTNLAGYQIRYGRNASDLSQTINLTNPSFDRYLIENLSAGTWYFAILAVNSEGAMSAQSTLASTTIS